jgi:cytochrome P450
MSAVPAHVPADLVRPFDYHQDPDFLSDPHLAFERIRDQRVFFSPRYGGYWVLTRAEDIRLAFQQPDIFSSREFSIPTGIYPRVLRPLSLDPPDHGTYRQPLAPLFAPNSVARREKELRGVCADLVEGFAGDGKVDLVAGLARPFPTTVFVSILGLPVAEAPVFEQWNHDLLHAYDEPERRQQAAKNILSYLDDLVGRRMAEGPLAGEDLFSVLLKAKVSGRALTHDELLDYAFMLFIAGLDTVTASLGFSLHCLATRPDLQVQLASGQSLVSAAVEEFLRAYSIINTARVVTQDASFAGVEMRAGDRVLLSTPLAGRDPYEVDQADQIVLDRQVNRHLAFGAGPHRCLGSHLARLELRIALEELLRRVRAFRLQDGAEVVRHGGGALGIDQLPVCWQT